MAAPDAETTALSRRLARAAERAVLGTLLPDGAPYASLVLVATASDGTPLLLLSELAEHTRNLRRDPRASLLVDGTAGHVDPLTGPRLTLQGMAAVIDDNAEAEAARARFLARHPGAAVYAGFGDFRFWRVAVERGHLVAGFGRIAWLPGDALVLAEVGSLVGAEPGIVAHMNEDHADAVDLYAQRLLGRAGTGWRMIAIDPEGCDLRRGDETARLDFTAPVLDAAAARRELVRLVGTARERGPGTAPS